MGLNYIFIRHVNDKGLGIYLQPSSEGLKNWVDMQNLGYRIAGTPILS